MEAINPVDFLMLKFEITLCTYVSVVGLKENLSFGSFDGLFSIIFQCWGGLRNPGCIGENY